MRDDESVSDRPSRQGGTSVEDKIEWQIHNVTGSQWYRLEPLNSQCRTVPLVPALPTANRVPRGRPEAFAPGAVVLQYSATTYHPVAASESKYISASVPVPSGNLPCHASIQRGGQCYSKLPSHRDRGLDHGTEDARHLC